jgi:hypothetical protein
MTISAGTVAGLVLDGVAVAVGTTVAVIRPVETAAAVMTRAVRGDEQTPEVWVPAGHTLRWDGWAPPDPRPTSAREAAGRGRQTALVVEVPAGDHHRTRVPAPACGAGRAAVATANTSREKA